MGFKQLSYWLRGGIIGLIIAIVFSVVIGLSVFLPGDASFGYQFILIPYIAIASIIFGLIFGLIIGKIKRK